MARKSKTKAYKPSSVLPHFQPLDFEEYAWKGQTLREATTEDLARIVRRAAKSANQRLRRLEQTGLEKSPAYKGAMANLGGKTRFKERTGKQDRASLLQEYYKLRDFLGAKSSTPTGIEQIQDNRYQAARERGFEGSKEEFNQLVEKFFNKRVEGLLSSDVVYTAITENRADILDAIMDDINSGELDNNKSMMQEYIRRFEGIV